MVEFDLIRPADLRRVWAGVRAGLDAMPPEDWIAEDVYHAIKSGESALYVARGGGGFVVFRRLVAEFSGTVSLALVSVNVLVSISSVTVTVKGA